MQNALTVDIDMERVSFVILLVHERLLRCVNPLLCDDATTQRGVSQIMLRLDGDLRQDIV